MLLSMRVFAEQASGRKHSWCLKGAEWIGIVMLCLSIFSLSSPAAANSDWLDLFLPPDSLSTVIGFGAGAGHADVHDPDNRLQGESYINETGFSLNLRLASELAINNAISLQAGADVFSSASLASLFSATASYGVAVSAGVLLGKVAEPRQPYLSLAFGWGGVALSDQGPDTDCIICSGDQGGWAGGHASRVAVGFRTKRAVRFELAWIRAGGDGRDSDFPDGVDAYLNTLLLVVSIVD